MTKEVCRNCSSCDKFGICCSTMSPHYDQEMDVDIDTCLEFDPLDDEMEGQ